MDGEPETEKAPKDLRQDLDFALVPFALATVGVDGLDEAVDGCAGRRCAVMAGEMLPDRLFDDGALGAAGRGAILREAFSEGMTEARVDTHAPHFRYGPGDGLVRRHGRV